MPPRSDILHASCISLDGRGALIVGRAGSGKSTLALQMMAYGAALVADDGVALSVGPEGLIARAAPGLPHLIEARGVGLLNAALQPESTVTVVVDLDRSEDDRLPHAHDITLMDHRLPLLRAGGLIHFAPALLQYLRAGRRTP